MIYLIDNFKIYGGQEKYALFLKDFLNIRERTLLYTLSNNLSKKNFYKKHKLQLLDIKKFLSILRDSKSKIILNGYHSHLLSLIFFLFHKKNKIYLVHHLHFSQLGGDFNFLKKLAFKISSILILKLPYLHVFVSESQKHRSRNEKGIVIKNYCLDKKFSQEKTLENCFVWAARLDKQKDPITLIKGWEIFNKQNNYKFKLYIYGAGPLEVEILRYIKNKKLNIKFKGYIDDPLRFHQDNYFISTSLYEGCSLSLLEAISNNMRIICTKISENIEVCGKNAIYFESQDSKSLCRALSDSINFKYKKNNPYYLKQFKEYSLENFKKNWLNLIYD